MFDFNWSQYVQALPEMFLALMVLICLMVGVFSAPENAARNSALWARLSLLGTLALVVLGSSGGFVGAFPQLKLADGSFAGYMFVADAYATVVKAILLVAAVVALAVGRTFMKRIQLDKPEYNVLLLVSVLGMMLMASAADLLVVYIGLEMMSFALYILAAFHRENKQSAEAGLKYFVLGSLASCMLLFGISLIYGFAGSTSFEVVAAAINGFSSAETGHIGLMVAMVLVLTGLAFKISAAPFHMWTPDVYQGAPTAVTSMMSVLPKIAAFALLMRILTQPFSALEGQWAAVMVVLAVMTMAVGSLLAILQNNIKRLLAYSSIAHVGFMLVALATGGSAAAVESVLIYLAIYAVMTFGGFAVLMALQVRGHYVETIDDMRGLGTNAPFMALCMLVFMFSLAGVPPLAGFFAKFYVFKAAVDAGMVWLAVLGVLFSVIAAYYCLKMVKAMYFETGGIKVDNRIPWDQRLMVGGLAALTVILALFIDNIAELAGVAARSLF